MGQITRDITSDSVPHRNGRNVCERVYHRLVTLEVLTESLRVFVDKFDRYSLDVGGSYSSHIVHRVNRLIDNPYLRFIRHLRLAA